MFKFEYKSGKFAFGQLGEDGKTVIWITRRRNLPKALPTQGVTHQKVKGA